MENTVNEEVVIKLVLFIFFFQFSWGGLISIDILNHYYLNYWFGFILIFADMYVVLSLSQWAKIQFFLILNLEFCLTSID